MGLSIGVAAGLLIPCVLPGTADPPDDASPSSAVPIDPELQWAVRLSSGPVEDLTREGHYFLAVVDRFPAVSQLWIGVQRLALAVDALPEGERPQMRQHCLRAARSKAAPAELQPLVEYLSRHKEKR